MTIAAVLLMLALQGGGGWFWTPDKTAAELEARYAVGTANPRQPA